MSESPTCTKCNSEYPYQDGGLWICPECGHEWSALESAVAEEAADQAGGDGIIRDANGNELKDGDTVTVIKTLKVKGAAGPLKAGTKVKNIRLVPDATDGHDIACKIDGFGAMALKSSIVKKA